MSKYTVTKKGQKYFHIERDHENWKYTALLIIDEATEKANIEVGKEYDMSLKPTTFKRSKNTIYQLIGIDMVEIYLVDNIVFQQKVDELGGITYGESSYTTAVYFSSNLAEQANKLQAKYTSKEITIRAILKNDTVAKDYLVAHIAGYSIKAYRNNLVALVKGSVLTNIDEDWNKTKTYLAGCTFELSLPKDTLEDIDPAIWDYKINN
jgi:hypothetical protein